MDIEIKKRIKDESLKVLPINNDSDGFDLNLTKRNDWVNVCNKGVEIMCELMEKLKDFDEWKEWKNTDPIEEIE